MTKIKLARATALVGGAAFLPAKGAQVEIPADRITEQQWLPLDSAEKKTKTKTRRCFVLRRGNEFFLREIT